MCVNGDGTFDVFGKRVGLKVHAVVSLTRFIAVLRVRFLCCYHFLRFQLSLTILGFVAGAQGSGAL